MKQECKKCCKWKFKRLGQNWFQVNVVKIKMRSNQNAPQIQLGSNPNAAQIKIRLKHKCGSNRNFDQVGMCPLIENLPPKIYSSEPKVDSSK